MSLVAALLASSSLAGALSGECHLGEVCENRAAAKDASLLQVHRSSAQLAATSGSLPWWREYGHDADSASRKLVQLMTWEEKKRLLIGYGDSWEMFMPRDNYYIGTVRDVPRLHVPSTNMMDGGQGFRTVKNRLVGTVTSWPSALATISAWDPELTQKYARHMGREYRAKGANAVLGPGLDLVRVARGGRSSESLIGEDPLLGAVHAAAYIRGFQSQGVATVAKHWILNTQETNRQSHSNSADERTLWEMHYPAWEAAVKAGLASVMCAYSSVDGVGACSSPGLQRDLKERMGFKGYVMTDWWAVKAHETVSSAKNGADLMMPGSNPGATPVWDDAALMAAGDDRVDDMVQRFLHGMIGSTAFDWAPCTEGISGSCELKLYNNVTTKEDADFALEIAESSVVLLKNEDGLLPLKRTMRLAVLGSACDAAQDQNPEGRAWNFGDYYTVGGSGRVVSPLTRTIYQGLEARGVAVERLASDSVDEAMALLEGGAIDAAVACGGVGSGEARDRASLNLDQHQFLVDLARRNTGGPKIPLVVVTMSTGSVLTDFAKNSQAVVSTFMTGQATGDAVANVLLGDANPSGKLVVSFPSMQSDLQDVCPAQTCTLSDGLFVGYRNLFGKPVAFPFGHGLSYTTFKYEWAKKPSVANRRVSMRVRIENSGAKSGREVAQVYLRFPGSAGEPEWVLRGFHKTQELAPGESETLSFELEERATSVWNACSDGDSGHTGSGGSGGGKASAGHGCDAEACVGAQCFTCRARIAWLMSAGGGSRSAAEARDQVCVREFPAVCGDCHADDIASLAQARRAVEVSPALVVSEALTTPCHAWRAVDGEFEVFVGSSSRDEQLKASFEI